MRQFDNSIYTIHFKLIQRWMREVNNIWIEGWNYNQRRLSRLDVLHWEVPTSGSNTHSYNIILVSHLKRATCFCIKWERSIPVMFTPCSCGKLTLAHAHTFGAHGNWTRLFSEHSELERLNYLSKSHPSSARQQPWKRHSQRERKCLFWLSTSQSFLRIGRTHLFV